MSIPPTLDPDVDTDPPLGVVIFAAALLTAFVITLLVTGGLKADPPEATPVDRLLAAQVHPDPVRPCDRDIEVQDLETFHGAVEFQPSGYPTVPGQWVALQYRDSEDTVGYSWGPDSRIATTPQCLGPKGN